MTDYNKRLDKILKSLAHQAYLTAHAPGHTKLDGRTYRAAVDEAKQANTSLMKELIAKAKPEKHKETWYNKYIITPEQELIESQKRQYNMGIDEFEQNLLKALEEV